MRRIISCLVFLIFVGTMAAQNIPTPTNNDGAQSSPAASSSPKESKKARRRSEKMEKARERERAAQASWEEATRPPEPAYPGSITPDFARAAAQATIVIDNAFNSMSKSRLEFAIANQSSIQYAAGLAASARNDGERQVSVILYKYSQKIPVCQEVAWEALQNVLTLIAEGGGVRACTNDLRRLRAQADRTYDRNR
jgi:hypothetical protein